MSDNYLIHGTNALKGALRYTVGEDFKYDKNSVELFLQIACTTLSQLLDDGETLHQISRGVSMPHENKFFYFKDFVEEFINPDKSLMIAAGMDKSLADYLFKDLERTQKVLREMETNSKSKISVETLRSRIEEIKYSACSKEAIRNKGRNGLPATLRRAINITGGGAIVTTNVMADGIIGGVASAFSQGYGGHLVMKGIEGSRG